MTQKKIDELFSQKRSRTIVNVNRDEFDDIFESKKRQRTNPKPIDDELFPTIRRKRSQHFDDIEQKKKTRCSPSQSQTIDLLDMFNTRSKTDDFKIPMITQNKVLMFFDDSDLISIREENDIKDYTQIKPVVITGGQWLSKDGETQSICERSTAVPDDERNLMHIQFVPLTLDDKPQKTVQSQPGKSFRKQFIVSDSNIVRKENLQSCYNALLEDVNKPRLNRSNAKTQDDVDFFDLPSRRKKS